MSSVSNHLNVYFSSLAMTFIMFEDTENKFYVSTVGSLLNCFCPLIMCIVTAAHKLI